MKFEIKQNHFYLDNKKIFLNSGEIHYFRIKRELWDTHLSEAKEAGLMAVSTYVPWAWHEAVEGVFDLNGASVPELDLEAWLQRCRAHGLYCILKPGPFILAETRGAGLPYWFLDKYGEQVKMRNSKGEIVPSDGVNLFNPVYLEKVGLWYDRIMPFISEHEISKGGPVIMMQICNEIGVFSWLAHQGDYGEGVKERFISFLNNRFNGIEQVNKLWGTDYADFDDVELPPDGRTPYQSKEDRGRDSEWHCFWRTYYGDYLRMLTKMARDRGVTVPFYHNLPGWIYGSGYEFPLNITMYEDLFGEKSEIIFGVDHIPEYLSHRNMHDDRIINDITLAMQGDKPLFAAEFQCGSREYHVVTNPREMELFYKASIAHGLTGWNYYMFSRGRNPRQKGYSGANFYWFTPLSPEGERSSLFPLVKRMSRILETSKNIILDTKRKAEVCVLFYPPYYATELEHPETGASGLQFNASSIRRPAYFDGLLKVLQVMNMDYDMADLNQVSGGDISNYRQVWAFSTDEMNAGAQEALVDYAVSGGNLVIFPCLPDREMSQKPCSILRDAISVHPSATEVIDSPLIDIYGHQDIKCANPQVVYDEGSLEKAEIIARTIRGTACGFEKPLGKGSVIHLGTWMGFDTEGHKPVYDAILKRSAARLQNASSGNENLTVRQRFTADGQGLLFIGNYYNEEQTGSVSYTHPGTGEMISIPYLGSELTWPALYGVLTPLCMEIADGIRILHCTSDILDISFQDDRIEMALFGDRDLLGEIVLEGENAEQVRTASIDGKSLEIIKIDDRIVLNYHHHHKQEQTLIIQI
ncbi:MAG: beta-galactosidase [Bacteroidales bacterium]|nr:beta-galactosidase [Bacteroidales bacterium]